MPISALLPPILLQELVHEQNASALSEETQKGLSELCSFLRLPLVVLDMDMLEMTWMCNEFTQYTWQKSNPNQPFLLADFVHPEDIPRIMQDLRYIKRFNAAQFESVYRLLDSTKNWNWAFVRCQILNPQPHKSAQYLLVHIHHLTMAIQNSNFVNTLQKEEKDFVSKIFTKKISAREKEVLMLLADALTDEDIADRLNISKLTVISHRKNLLRKLKVANKAELVKFVFENGLK
jgi:DNA-binding CsgD family transcriptional regulator